MTLAPRIEVDLEDLLGNVRQRALRVLGHFRIPEQDADDLLQQAFLVLLHKGREARDPERWFLGVLRNLCRRYWQGRRNALYTSVDDALLERLAAPVDPDQGRSDVRRDLDAALGRVPARCEKLLRLRYLQGYRPVEAARHLGYRASSVYKVLQRCIASLTTCLTSRPAEPGGADA